jgi:hypothetical protein
LSSIQNEKIGSEETSKSVLGVFVNRKSKSAAVGCPWIKKAGPLPALPDASVNWLIIHANLSCVKTGCSWPFQWIFCVYFDLQVDFQDDMAIVPLPPETMLNFSTVRVFKYPQ